MTPEVEWSRTCAAPALLGLGDHFTTVSTELSLRMAEPPG